MSQQMETAAHTLEDFGYKQELKRSLKPWQMAIFGLVFMIPIAPFGIYGFLAEASNNMVPLVYAIGMFAMIFTAFSYGRMAEAFPIAGSVYAYTSRGINKHLGFMTGWAILLDYILMPTLIYVVCGASMNAIFPEVSILVWAFIFLAIVTFFNIKGIEASAKLSVVALAFEMVVYVAFVIFAVMAILKGTNDTHFTVDPIFNAKNFSLAMVMNGVSIAVLSFLGFDAISTLAEETKGGGKAVGRATISALLILGGLFIFLTWIAGCLWPDFKAFNSIDTAFYEIANLAGGKTLLTLCSTATALSWGFAALTAQVAVSRVLFSMSRDGNFPKAFSKVHPKYQTPYVATWFIAGVSLIMCVLFQSKINELTILVNFGALTSFFILNLAVIYYYKIRIKAEGIFKYVITPLIGAVIVGYVWFSLSNQAKVLGLVWLACGIVYYIILIKIFKKSAELEL
ncbi:amino acid permease [Aminipila terrae]|uniref:Amino acid permease n=2 Tax=Aminipila terrae TaxID=2697030 RepID=A0A6P1MKW4_9FIRM|nr:amino acid permease [Aminipila terrae]